MGLVYKARPCTTPGDSGNLAVQLADLFIQGMVTEVFLTLEDADIPCNAEVVHALATTGFGHARTLAIERVLFLVGASTADDADIVPLGFSYSLGGFQPEAGSSLGFRYERGDVTLLAVIKAAVLRFQVGGIVEPFMGCSLGLAAIDAIYLAGLVSGKGQ